MLIAPFGLNSTRGATTLTPAVRETKTIMKTRATISSSGLISQMPIKSTKKLKEI